MESLIIHGAIESKKLPDPSNNLKIHLPGNINAIVEVMGHET